MYIEYRYTLGLYCLIKPPRNVHEYGYSTVHKRYVHDDFGNLVEVMLW